MDRGSGTTRSKIANEKHKQPLLSRAARPNEPPLDTLQRWLSTLEKAVGSEQRSVIVGVLKDAIPAEVAADCCVSGAKLPPPPPPLPPGWPAAPAGAG